MPASTSSPPSPPPPASATSAAAAATPRHRRRLLPSSSASSSSTTSSSPFSLFPPSPSAFHRFLPSPFRASSVPFSWEHRPGIPKTPARSRSSSSSKAGKTPLPLPPSLLSRAADPYASSDVVPAEYAAMPEHRRRQLGRARVPRRSRLRRRPRPRVADALAEWLCALSLYRSCKRAAACFAAKLKSPAA